jgi:hypothetical protein
MQSAERLERLRIIACRALELYVSDCLARATGDNATYWHREAMFGEAAKLRINDRRQKMVASAAGEDVPEIDRQPEAGRNLTITAGGDVVVSDVRDSTNVAAGKGIDQDAATGAK